MCVCVCVCVCPYSFSLLYSINTGSLVLFHLHGVKPSSFLSQNLAKILKIQTITIRPITLTSCLCKTFERTINNRLVWYLDVVVDVVELRVQADASMPHLAITLIHTIYSYSYFI